MKQNNFILVLLILIILIFSIFNYHKVEKYTNYKIKQNAWKVLESGKIFNYDGINDNSFTPQTINNEMKLKMNSILGKILNDINEKTGSSYFLRKIDRINVNLLKKGEIGFEELNDEIREFTLGARYTVDFFAHEIRHMHTKRFIVIFVIDKLNNLTIEHINLSNAFILPENLHSDDVSDKLILTDDSLSDNTHHIKGVKTGTLDSSNYLPNDNQVINKYIKANNYEISQSFLPISIQENNLDNLPKFPNRKQSKWWDNFGIKYTEPSGKNKIGIDYGVGKRPQQNYDNPTVNKMVTDTDIKNSWLFKGATGNLGIPKGQVVM